MFIKEKAPVKCILLYLFLLSKCIILMFCLYPSTHVHACIALCFFQIFKGFYMYPKI